MTPLIGQYCTRCAALNLRSLVYREDDDGSEPPPGISLGVLEDMIQRSDRCQLCSLIVDALRARYRRTPSRHMSDVYYSYISDSSDDEDDDGDGNAVDESKQAAHSTRNDDISKYGMPVTWLEQPIECHITPTFFCSQDNISDFNENVENTQHTIEQADLERGKSLYIYRLLVTLSPSPWVTFSATDAVTLQASWENNHQIADDTKHSSRTISPVGSGRKVGLLIDTSRIRGWLHQCEDVHGHRCANPDWADASGDVWNHLTLRVIDVTERRVVDLPPQGRYLALSYVWGANEEEHGLHRRRCLTTRNQSRLQEVNGLDMITVPQTILDAMSLTLDLGERYLWVDSLCILQDDANDLNMQTSRMDCVYSGAILTILAVSGCDAESGLAGLPRQPRDIFHRTIQISPDGLCLSTIAALSDQDSLQYSVWNERGWTFQERLLSRRALVVCPSQTYWLCESSTWDEETILEPTEPSAWVLPQALKCNDEWDDGDAKFSKVAFGTYITQYSTRKLTFPSDASSAFFGIIRRFEHLHNEDVFWGVPTVRFDQNLVWKNGTSRRNEMQLVLLNGSIAHKIPYPSWTWLGWVGFIGANIYNRSLALSPRGDGSKSELLFYSLMSDGTVRPLHNTSSLAVKPQHIKVELTKQDDITRADSISTWKGETTVTGPIKLPPNKQRNSNQSGLDTLEKRLLVLDLDLPVHDTGRLVFRTSHAQVQGWFSNSMLSIRVGDGILELPSNFPNEIVISRGPITLSHSTGNLNSLSEDDLVTFSRHSSPILDEEVADFQIPQAMAESTLDLIIISRFYNISQHEETGKLNIMIVKENSFQAGVWSRLGVAVIEETDWLQFESNWEMIILG